MRFFRMSNRSHRKVERAKSEAVRWMLMPFHVTGVFFRSMWAALSSWWGRRNIRYLLQGIPALLVFVGVVVVGVFCAFQDKTVLANMYQAKAQGSLREASQLIQANRDPSKPLAMAQSCYNRLTYLQPDNQDNRFHLARAYEQKAVTAAIKAKGINDKIKDIKDPAEKEKQQKELDQLIEEDQTMRAATFRLMNTLAPPDRKGYGQAHLWMFEQLYRLQRAPDGKILPPSPAAILQAERHLLHALEWPTADVVLGAHFGLARMYRDIGRIEDAKRHLSEVAARFPEYRLTLAQWAKVQGENDLALNHARAAENVFRSRLTTSLDDHEARFGLVECLMLQNRFNEAQDAINIGATLGASNQDLLRAYSRKMVSLLLAWADFKENDPRSTIAERLTLLDEALKIEPDNPELFSRLMKLTKDKTPEAEKAREVFRKYAVEQDRSAMAQLFLGIDAYQQNRTEEARYHWEKAFKLSNGAPLVANNLAWAVAFYPPVDLPRALEMINAAIEKAPNEPRFKGTRGHILAKMKRYKEALPDLEDSVKVYNQDPNLYRVLSETCAALGYERMAAEYKSREEALKGKSGATVQPSSPAEKKPDATDSELKPPPGKPADKPEKDGGKAAPKSDGKPPQF